MVSGGQDPPKKGVDEAVVAAQKAGVKAGYLQTATQRAALVEPSPPELRDLTLTPANMAPRGSIEDKNDLPGTKPQVLC